MLLFKKKVKDMEVEKKKEETKIVNRLIMDLKNCLGNKEVWNKEMKGFTLKNVVVHIYGLSADIYAPSGMVLEDLSTHTPLIETGCKCQFLYEIPQHKKYAKAIFIYPDQIKINDWDFVPIKVNPWEFCPGYNILGEPIILNLNITPHILIAGQQRKGKNGSADHAIVSWIHSCNEKEIVFYLFQAAKNDMSKYMHCKQVYCYAETLKDISIGLDSLREEYSKRKKLFAPMIEKANGKDNLYHYNLLHPNNKLPYIIVVIDEFIELMAEATMDDKNTKFLKANIMKRIRQIGQFGGSMGINYCVLHQRPIAVFFPSFLKNMSSVRICYDFDDLVCCEGVLGSEAGRYAYKIPRFKAYYSTNEESGYLYTPNMSKGIDTFIKDSKSKYHKTVFDELKKELPIEKEVIQGDIDNGIVPLPDNFKFN